MWFHGGGWVTGNLDTHDQLVPPAGRRASARSSCRSTTGSRPRRSSPAAVDDCVAACEWALAHADELGGDPAAIAIGGDSAGGNLAAVVALDARDGGLPQPKLQLLVYPVTDYEFDSAVDDRQRQGLLPRSRHACAGSTTTTPRTPADFDDLALSPLRAPDLVGAAPARRDHRRVRPAARSGRGVRQRRLRDADVPTEVVRADGLFHGFFGMHEFLPPGQEPWDVVGRARCARAFGTA